MIGLIDWATGGLFSTYMFEIAGVALIGAAILLRIYAPTSLSVMAGYASTVLVAAGVVLIGYSYGYGAARSACRDASLTIQLAQRDARVAELQRQMEAQQRIAANGAQRASAAEIEANAERQRADDYEAKIRQIAAAGCLIDDSDVGGMR